MRVGEDAGMTQGLLFGWVHLSDIHIGHGGARHRADQELVLRKLREDVAAQIAAGVPKPDVVLVTGDIAFSGACREVDEYTRAAEWLGKIAAAVGLGPDAVYVVPGNHDVQRPVDKPMAAKNLLKALRKGDDHLDDALQDADTRKQLAARQAHYLAFAKGFAPACRADRLDASGLYWHHTLDARGGLRVRLCGLNTALLAAAEEVFGTDKGALWLGNRQLADVLPAERDAREVVMVLSHHPFVEGWLRDERDARDWTRSHAHIHLSGHVHEAANERTRSGAGTDFVHIAAGAAHGEAMPEGVAAQHGYSFGAMLAEGDGVVLRVWPRRWSERGKRFQRDLEAADEQTGFATHRIAGVRLPGAGSSGGASRRTSAPSVVVGHAPVVASAAPDAWDLLCALEGLLDPQFERMLFLVEEAQRALIPSVSALRTMRAIELIRLLMQKPNGLQRLHSAIHEEPGPRHIGPMPLAVAIMPAQAPWATVKGCDAYGLWAEVTVAGVAFRMRWLPPGRFVMGSPESEEGRYDDEGPQYTVVLTQGLWLGEVPVTQALWKAVMGDNPSAFQGDDRPVELVSWGECQRFVKAMNKKVAGLDLRLPSEAEWEYACRAGTQGPTWLGANSGENLDRIAWYRENSGGGTHPVGGKAANPFGLHDMLGNLWEWCEDRYVPYQAVPVVDPPLPDSGIDRVIRSGCWNSRAAGVRAALRNWSLPDSRDVGLGFRLARGPSAPSQAGARRGPP